jgi:hypothetical protein
MSEEDDRKTIGASERGRRVLKWLAERAFPEEMDAYRFAIALGLSVGRQTPLVGRQTSFNLGSFDKDGSVATLIRSLIAIEPSQTYRAAEELAETGFALIEPTMGSGEFRFEDMLEIARNAKQPTG